MTSLSVTSALLGCERAVVEPTDARVMIAVVAGAATQSVTVGTATPIVPSVRVLGAAGAPISGAVVVFGVTRGRGFATASRILTDASGIATVGSWVMGRTAGPQELTASVASSTTDARVVFAATAVPGPPAADSVSARVLLALPADTMSIVAILLDAFGNVVAPLTPPTFASTDPSIATVSPTGLVTGVSTGTTTVSVTLDGALSRVRVGVGSPAPTFTVTTKFVGLGSNAVAIWGNIAYAAVFWAGVMRINIASETSDTILSLVGSATDVAFLPDGSRAYVTGSWLGGVAVIDPTTDSVLRVIPVSDPTLRVRASSDGAFVYATTAIGEFVRIEAATDQTVSIQLGGVLNGLALNPVDPVAYVTSDAGRLFEIDLTTFALSRTRVVGGVPQGVAVSPDGRRVLVARRSGMLEERDATSLELAIVLDVVSGAFDVAVSPNGRFLYASEPDFFGRVLIIDAHSLIVRGAIAAAYSPRRIAIAADGSIAIVAHESGWLTFIR